MPYNVSADVDSFLRSADKTAAKNSLGAVSAGSSINDQENSLAVGQTAVTNDKDALAVGVGANASHTSTAVGYGAAGGAFGVAVGAGAYAGSKDPYDGQPGNTAVGWSAYADYNSVAFGYGSNAQLSSCSFGAGAYSGALSASGSVAIGRNSFSYEGVSVGSLAYSSSRGSIAVGEQAQALGLYCSSFGYLSISNYGYGPGVAIGTSASATSGVAIGDSAVADQDNSTGSYGSVAIAPSASAFGTGIAIGKSSASSDFGVSIGGGSYSAYSGVALGAGAYSGGAGSIAIGNIAYAGSSELAIGNWIRGFSYGDPQVFTGFGYFPPVFGQSDSLYNLPQKMTWGIGDNGLGGYSLYAMLNHNGTIYSSDGINLYPYV